MARAAKLPRRSAIVALAIAAVVVAIAHASIARHARTTGSSASCPFARTTTNVAALDRSRRLGVASLRGEGVVADRAFLGFTLGVSTRADLEAWSKRIGVACGVERGGALVRCTHVPSSAFAADLPIDSPEIADLVVRLDDRARVVAVDALATTTDAAAALSAIAHAQRRLDARLPTPVDRTGPIDAAGFDASPFAHAAISARYANWAVDVGATTRNEPGHVVVRWQSRALD